MDQRAIEHHLRQSEFTAVQAGTLSHLLAEQATRDDLRVLSSELRGEMAKLRAELRGELRTHDERLDRRLAEMQVRLAWIFIAAAAFMGTVMTLLGTLVN